MDLLAFFHDWRKKLTDNRPPQLNAAKVGIFSFLAFGKT
jgi:hypothetical protein